MQTSNYSYDIDINKSYYWYNINTDPILRYYDNDNCNCNINTDPIFRSFDQISNTGDDPFLYYFPYPSEFYDNYIMNLYNYNYNLKTYYLHKK